MWVSLQIEADLQFVPALWPFRKVSSLLARGRVFCFGRKVFKARRPLFREP